MHISYCRMNLTSILHKVGIRKETSGLNKFANMLSGGLSVLQNSEFIRDIFSDKLLTPHEEMRQTEQAYRMNTYIVQGVDYLSNVILGREQWFESKDKATGIYFNDFVLPRLKSSLREGVENYVKQGNGYIEVQRGTSSDLPLKYTAISRPEKMYIQVDDDLNIVRYVYSMPNKKGNKRYRITYLDSHQAEMVRGIEFPTQDIVHLKMGTSHVPWYGRSPLASATSDVKILREIERDYAVITRFKTIAKKLIQARNIDGTAINDDELQQLIRYFDTLTDFENPVVGNKEIKVDDMSYAGQHENLEPMLQYFLKKATIGIIPSYFIHPDVTNYAVANKQESLYFLMVQSLREQILEQLQPLFQEIARKKNLSTDVTLKFGEFDFPTKEQTFNETLQLWESGLITVNEARDRIDLKPVGDEDLGDAYKWMVSPTSPVEQGINDLISNQRLKGSGEKGQEKQKGQDIPSQD